MSELMWKTFEKKYEGIETIAFEHLCYDYFCLKFKIKEGLRRYPSHPKIETDPYPLKESKKGEYYNFSHYENIDIKGNIAFQAKYFKQDTVEVDISQIEKSFDDIKSFYPNLDFIILFSNKESSSSKTNKYNKYKKKFEKDNKIKIIEIFRSNLEQIFSVYNNETFSLRREYFEDVSEIVNFENRIKQKNKIFENISKNFFNYNEYYNKINKTKVNIIKINGAANTGKTYFLNMFYQKKKENKENVFLLEYKDFINNIHIITDKSFLEKRKIEKCEYIIIDNYDNIKNDYFLGALKMIIKNNIKIIIAAKDFHNLDIDGQNINMNKGLSYIAMQKEISHYNIKENNQLRLIELQNPFLLDSLISNKYKNFCSNQSNETNENVLDFILNSELKNDYNFANNKNIIKNLINLNILKKEKDNVVFENSYIKENYYKYFLLKSIKAKGNISIVEDYIEENISLQRAMKSLIREGQLDKKVMLSNNKFINVLYLTEARNEQFWESLNFKKNLLKEDIIQNIIIEKFLKPNTKNIQKTYKLINDLNCHKKTQHLASRIYCYLENKQKSELEEKYIKYSNNINEIDFFNDIIKIKRSFYNKIPHKDLIDIFGFKSATTINKIEEKLKTKDIKIMQDLKDYVYLQNNEKLLKKYIENLMKFITLSEKVNYQSDILEIEKLFLNVVFEYSKINKKELLEIIKNFNEKYINIKILNNINIKKDRTYIINVKEIPSSKITEELYLEKSDICNIYKLNIKISDLLEEKDDFIKNNLVLNFINEAKRMSINKVKTDHIAANISLEIDNKEKNKAKVILNLIKDKKNNKVEYHLGIYVLRKILNKENSENVLFFINNFKTLKLEYKDEIVWITKEIYEHTQDQEIKKEIIDFFINNIDIFYIKNRGNYYEEIEALYYIAFFYLKENIKLTEYYIEYLYKEICKSFTLDKYKLFLVLIKVYVSDNKYGTSYEDIFGKKFKESNSEYQINLLNVFNKLIEYKSLNKEVISLLITTSEYLRFENLITNKHLIKIKDKKFILIRVIKEILLNYKNKTNKREIIDFLINDLYLSENKKIDENDFYILFKFHIEYKNNSLEWHKRDLILKNNKEYLSNLECFLIKYLKEIINTNYNPYLIIDILDLLLNEIHYLKNEYLNVSIYKNLEYILNKEYKKTLPNLINPHLHTVINENGKPRKLSIYKIKNEKEFVYLKFHPLIMLINKKTNGGLNKILEELYI